MTDPIEPNTDVSPVEPIEQEPTVTPQPPDPEPVTTPPAVPQVPDGPPDGFVEQARFTGAIQKIEELTISNRTQATALEAKSSELEQLKSQASTKAQETNIVVGERDKLLNASAEEVRTLNTEAIKLRAYQRKVEMAKKIGRPELINVLDIVPDMEDNEALETVMRDIIGFRDSGIEQREKELTSGIVPNAPRLESVPSKPTTEEGWKSYVDSFQVGSDARAVALNEHGDWMFAKPK